jgi:hypothetical protein
MLLEDRNVRRCLGSVFDILYLVNSSAYFGEGEKLLPEMNGCFIPLHQRCEAINERAESISVIIILNIETSRYCRLPTYTPLMRRLALALLLIANSAAIN